MPPKYDPRSLLAAREDPQLAALAAAATDELVHRIRAWARVEADRLGVQSDVLAAALLVDARDRLGDHEQIAAGAARAHGEPRQAVADAVREPHQSNLGRRYPDLARIAAWHRARASGAEDDLVVGAIVMPASWVMPGLAGTAKPRTPRW
ncbi:hypothetical protein [Gryllotalpicola protaetiae]|uniref:hypothetical protein n=1 Tax=Gryllotalpicola protaetiae TaxID=2419771 RepID=UPI0013C4182C|nr:hypothetical protein [Gryllotalpicola protaetiae]